MGGLYRMTSFVDLFGGGKEAGGDRRGPVEQELREHPRFDCAESSPLRRHPERVDGPAPAKDP